MVGQGSEVALPTLCDKVLLLKKLTDCRWANASGTAGILNLECNRARPGR